MASVTDPPLEFDNIYRREPPQTGVKDVALVPTAPDGGLASVIERLAANPQVDVAKLEKIIELQERILRHQAEQAFNVAFSALQSDIPTIIEKASTDKATYAPLEDIIEPVRPVLSRHGFSLSFRTEWPTDKSVKVIGILTHREGHARQSEFLSAADQSGSKNPIQALASAVSYGKRYTCKDLLCIVTRGEDDDAEKAVPKKAPEAPEGYDAWLAILEGVADSGMPAFSDAWNESQPSYRKHLASTDPKRLAAIKTCAIRVKAK
jgi:hypothetical protein